MKSRVLLLAAVLVSVFAFACGGTEEGAAENAAPTAAESPSPSSSTTTPSSSTAANRDACSVLGADVLSETANITATGTASTSGGASVCTWTSNTGKSVIVQLYGAASDYESARRAFEGLYESSAENVSGVGEEAFFIAGETGPFPTATVTVRSGSSAFSVQVMAMGEEPSALRQQALDISNRVLASL